MDENKNKNKMDDTYANAYSLEELALNQQIGRAHV